MAKAAMNDALWERISRLLPPAKVRRFRYPGRKPLDDRQVLTGILHVLKTGIPWDALPQDLGYGSGMSCWNRLSHWQQTGAWPKIEEMLKAQLPDTNQYDWSRAIVGKRSRKRRKGKRLGPNDADRQNGSKKAVAPVRSTKPRRSSS